MQFVSSGDKSKAFIREETLVLSLITRDEEDHYVPAIHGKSVVSEQKINNVFQFVTPIQRCPSRLINAGDILFPAKSSSFTTAAETHSRHTSAPDRTSGEPITSSPESTSHETTFGLVRPRVSPNIRTIA